MNVFYQATADHMTVQINYLQDLIGRQLTISEKENIHEFFSELDLNVQYAFESECGELL